MTRFSLKTGAVNRFYLTVENRCAFLDQLRSLVQAKWPQFHQDEMQSPRMPKDEEQVLAVEAVIECWNNPFVGNQDLNRISTAKDAPVDMPYDLLHTCGAWEQKFLQFKEERLQSSPHKKRFYDPVKLKNWRCLHHSVEKKTVSTQRRTMILKVDRSLFRRIIITGQCRKIEVKDKLQHSLGPMPWALSKAEGFPRKNNKAALAS